MSASTPLTLQQCDAHIATVRARIDALNREAALRAQQLAGERARAIPQPDWIAQMEQAREQQEQQSRDALAELARLQSIRTTLLAEQMQQE